MTLRECSGIGRAATRSEPSGVAGGTERGRGKQQAIASLLRLSTDEKMISGGCWVSDVQGAESKTSTVASSTSFYSPID